MQISFVALLFVVAIMAEDVAGDDSSIHSSVAGDEPPPRVERPRRPRDLRREGCPQVFVLLVALDGRWVSFAADEWPASWTRIVAGELLLVGLLLASAWLFTDVDTQPRGEIDRHMRE